MSGKKRLITPEQIESSKERRRVWDRERHQKNKENRNAARRLTHANNPERLRKIERERNKADPLRKKKVDIKCKYGELAIEAFLLIHHCESCGDYINGRNKHIDHDHSIGVKNFRGILCAACNVALGYLKEDEGRINKLLNYVKTRVNHN